MSSADRFGRPGAPVAAVALSLGAWLGVSLLATSPQDRYLQHDYQPDSLGGQGVAVVLFLGGWLLMCTAMMLPTSLQLLEDFRAAVRHHPGRRGLPLLVIAGFLTTWLAVGYTFRLCDVGLHALVDSVGRPAPRPQLIAGSALIVAGLFQFSALKHRCLTACRSPRAFVYRNWSEGRAAEAWRIGLDYGRSCVGCCWALMLVMFALGSVNLAWMLGLAALMALEKSMRMGAKASRPLGLALIAFGLIGVF